jgi:hypothetical protein
MKLNYDDVSLLLEHVDLPDELRDRLGRAPVELRLSDDDFAALNDACIALLQERGRDGDGGVTELGRRLETIVDALNDDD